MAGDRNPSGIPRDRAARPIYGPAEADIYGRVGNQHEGLRRVQRTLLIASVVTGIVIALVALFGSTTSAWGMFLVLLAPLLLILLGTSVAVVLTKPLER